MLSQDKNVASQLVNCESLGKIFWFYYSGSNYDGLIACSTDRLDHNEETYPYVSLEIISVNTFYRLIDIFCPHI